ncbi:MAG: exosortase [Alphaproteobacteria bacterium]|nr:exosortase [Alphaproteobacteria bacterium]
MTTKLDALPRLSRAWLFSIVSLAGGLAALGGLFHETLAEMVTLWTRSSAYNHAWLVPLVSLWLIRENREPLPSPRAGMLGLPLIGVAVVVWYFSRRAGIAEGSHFALMAMVQGLFLTVLGLAAYRALLFPLSYLWLMVPTGAFLIPLLRRVATDGSAWLLRASGIPVYEENFVFETPSGVYWIEPGCAGLNFLLASLALSLAFVAVTYRGWGKRLAGVALALALAVVGNAVRIWGIIAVAHVTKHRVDIVDDHLLWGWGFFAVLMMAAMAVGLRFRDREV